MSASIGTTYTRACSGLFSGLGIRDLVVVADGRLVLTSMPAYRGRTELLPVGDGVTAIAARPRGLYEFGNVLRPHDELVYADLGGVHRWWYDGARHDSLITGQCASATELITAQLDNDEKLEIVGVDSTRSHVFALTGLDGPTPQLVIGNLLPGIQAIGRYRPSGATTDRIVVATAAGLLELAAGVTGTATTVVAQSATNGRLATIRKTTGSAVELVAWVYQDGATDMVRTWPAVQPAANLGALGVRDVTSGDVDNNGWQDLVISQRTSHCVTVLLNIGQPALYFDVSYAIDLRLLDGGENITAPMNLVSPVAADFDNDDDIDIVMPVQSTNTLRMIECTSTQLLSRIVTATGGYFHKQGDGLTSTIDEAYFDVQRETTAPLNHIEAIGWEQADGCTSPDPVRHLGIWPSCSTNCFGNLSLPGCWYRDDGRYFVLLRPVQVTDGVVTKTGFASPGFLVIDAPGSEVYQVFGKTAPDARVTVHPDEAFVPRGPALPKSVNQVGWVTIKPPPVSESGGG